MKWAALMETQRWGVNDILVDSADETKRLAEAHGL
jgi:hypothetical protein